MSQDSIRAHINAYVRRHGHADMAGILDHIALYEEYSDDRVRAELHAMHRDGELMPLPGAPDGWLIPPWLYAAAWHAAHHDNTCRELAGLQAELAELRELNAVLEAAHELYVRALPIVAAKRDEYKAENERLRKLRDDAVEHVAVLAALLGAKGAA